MVKVFLIALRKHICYPDIRAAFCLHCGPLVHSCNSTLFHLVTNLLQLDIKENKNYGVFSINT